MRRASHTRRRAGGERRGTSSEHDVRLIHGGGQDVGVDHHGQTFISVPSFIV